MSVELLLTTLYAGAVVSASAVVEETTKEAYRALKDVVANVFGRKAQRAVDRLDADPSSPEARAEIASCVTDVPEEDADELRSKLDAFRAALERDVPARAAVERAQIDLDLDVKGNVLLEDIQNAGSIGVKTRSDGDFTLRRVGMARPGGKDTGK